MATTVSWRRLRKMVRIRDKSTCAYCGNLALAGDCDHVLPLSKGGSDNIDNLVWSCRKCNRGKGDKTLVEWIRQLLDRPQENPIRPSTSQDLHDVRAAIPIMHFPHSPTEKDYLIDPMTCILTIGCPVRMPNSEMMARVVSPVWYMHVRKAGDLRADGRSYQEIKNELIGRRKDTNNVLKRLIEDLDALALLTSGTSLEDTAIKVYGKADDSAMARVQAAYDMTYRHA